MSDELGSSSVFGIKVLQNFRKRLLGSVPWYEE